SARGRFPSASSRDAAPFGILSPHGADCHNSSGSPSLPGTSRELHPSASDAPPSPRNAWPSNGGTNPNSCSESGGSLHVGRFESPGRGSFRKGYSCLPAPKSIHCGNPSRARECPSPVFPGRREPQPCVVRSLRIILLRKKLSSRSEDRRTRLRQQLPDAIHPIQVLRFHEHGAKTRQG